MSWLDKLLPPRIKGGASASGGKRVPEGVWVKCPSCTTLSGYRTEFSASMWRQSACE